MEIQLKPTEIIMLDGQKTDFDGRMSIPIKDMKNLTKLEWESLQQLAFDYLDLNYNLNQWENFTIKELFSHLVY